MRLTLPLACVLMSAAFALAGISLKGETKVEQHKLVRLSVEGAPDNAAVLFDFDEEVLDAEQNGRSVVLTGPPGSYKVKATAITLDKDGKTRVEVARVTVVIVGKGPGPDPGPKPPDPGPGPDPGPKPPDPKPPTPSPAPIPLPGLRVLVIYEATEAADGGLTREQFSTIYGKAFRTLLDEKCVVGSDGKTREWRIYDKDVDVRGEAKHWQDVMKRKRDSVPWLVISNGKAGYEGSLPKTTEGTLNLIKQYGD